jgi:hypothetical protein
MQEISIELYMLAASAANLLMEDFMVTFPLRNLLVEMQLVRDFIHRFEFGEL